MIANKGLVPFSVVLQSLYNVYEPQWKTYKALLMHGQTDLIKLAISNVLSKGKVLAFGKDSIRNQI